ncbi:hypothetical protein XA68_17288 [Ophiocordyceps unilateralis]|uniref:Heme haloperoxidase family profile domain-containing protein n=1 Tax=Ophiocordyceps unilateralis TaxID=268505 RepID=A0A2A9PP88_OPHUN|nr:hypothetical protein XA68_17288 [Ophiocordyceps unilateralis]
MTSRQVYGMKTDIGMSLSKFGSVVMGDSVQWSIGDAPLGRFNATLGLKRPQGLINSHNAYEADASPTRCDLFQCGDNSKLQMHLFQKLYDEPLGPNGYDMSTIAAFRSKRLKDSKHGNPKFFYGPFTGYAVQSASHAFIYRFMANKSAEYPEGYLNGDVLKSFFAVTGSPGNLTYTAGHERIPDDWYRRAIGDEYGSSELFRDTLDMAAKYPEFRLIGGNLGAVDTFTPMNITALTHGVYNETTIVEGDNNVCLSLNVQKQLMENIAAKLFPQHASDTATGGEKVFKVKGLICPKLEAIDRSLFDMYPGAKGQLG